MENQATPVVTQQSTALDAVIIESGLQLDEAETIKQSYLPYFEQLAEIKEQASKIDFDNSTDIDETISRELRLKLVKIRTGSKDVKDDRKKIHSLKANLEQSAWNLIKDTCLLYEEKFSAVEKRREIEEKQRKENLRIERESAVEPYGADTEHIALGEMSEEVWENYFNGVKVSHEQKAAAELKSEEDRIAVEQAAADERSRIQEENERLQKEAEVKEKAMKAEREAAEKKLAEEQAKAEVERLALEEKARKEAEAVRQKAIVERKVIEEATRKEAEEKAKIEAELQAAKDAKAAAEAKSEAIVQAELSKGDVEKFKTILSDLTALKTKYQFESDEYKEKHFGVNGLIDKIIAHYQQN